MRLNRRLVKSIAGLVAGLVIAVGMTGCLGLGPGVDPNGAQPGSGTDAGTPTVNSIGSGNDRLTPMDPKGPGTTPPTDFTDLSSALPSMPGDGDFIATRDKRWVPVYFAYDQYFIGEKERPKLSALAEYLSQNKQVHLVVEGHCDERGSEEYNRGLGERRALAVKKYLAGLGVDESRIRTISYGEDRPADPGNTEEAHARNRRAEFVILLPKE